MTEDEIGREVLCRLSARGYQLSEEGRPGDGTLTRLASRTLEDGGEANLTVYWRAGRGLDFFPQTSRGSGIKESGRMVEELLTVLREMRGAKAPRR